MKTESSFTCTTTPNHFSFSYFYPSVSVSKYVDQGEDLLRAAEKVIESGIIFKIKHEKMIMEVEKAKV